MNTIWKRESKPVWRASRMLRVAKPLALLFLAFVLAILLVTGCDDSQTNSQGERSNNQSQKQKGQEQKPEFSRNRLGDVEDAPSYKKIYEYLVRVHVKQNNKYGMKSAVWDEMEGLDSIDIVRIEQLPRDETQKDRVSVKLKRIERERYIFTKNSAGDWEWDGSNFNITPVDYPYWGKLD